MPRYELSLITRALKNEPLADVLRRAATLVMEKGGVVRKMENLGEQELPYKIRAHNEWHTHGRYFVFDMDIGPTHLKSLEKELKIDTDLIRPRLVKQIPKKKLDQVLHCWTSYQKPAQKPIHNLGGLYTKYATH